MRPKGLRELTLLMCLFNLSIYYFAGFNQGYLLLFTSLIVLFSFMLLYFFWKGKNWARILVMITSVIALLNVFMLGNFGLAETLIILAEALLGIFLLYWLNKKEVVEFFKKNEKQPL